jgi:WD40 repeat protein
LANSFTHEPAKPSHDASDKAPSYGIVNTLTDPEKRLVSAVAFSPDGKTLVTSTNNRAGKGRIFLWNLATGRRTATLADPGGADPMALSPNGKVIASISSVRTYLWDVTHRHLMATLTDPVHPVDACGYVQEAFSPDGKTLALTEGNGTDLWDVATRRLIAFLAEPGAAEPGVLYVDSVAFSPDGKTLAVLVHGGDAPVKIDLWDVANRRRIGTIPGRLQDVSLAFSPDCKTLAFAVRL